MRHVLLALALAASPTIAIAQTSAPMPPAPARMSRSALEAEVTAQRALVQNGAVNPSPNAGCTAVESHQLDFWIGEWDVSITGETTLVAQSTIRPLDQGCSIFEEWRPFQGPGGHSISSFDKTDGAWHQEWMDAAGVRMPFKGAFADGVMRLDNLSPPPPGAPANLKRRMSYQAIDTSTVRQWGERFDDATHTWKTMWDYTYRRRAGTHG